MLIKDDLIRDKNRIIGGVCAAIAKKQNFNPWALRALFLFFSYFFYYTIIFYLLIWIYIPNKIKIEQKELNKSQIIGTSVGAILGALLIGGLGYLVMIILDDVSGNLGVFALTVMGFPIGAVIGFSIAKISVEKKYFKNFNEINE